MQTQKVHLFSAKTLGTELVAQQNHPIHQRIKLSLPQVWINNTNYYSWKSFSQSVTRLTYIFNMRAVDVFLIYMKSNYTAILSNFKFYLKVFVKAVVWTVVNLVIVTFFSVWQLTSVLTVSISIKAICPRLLNFHTKVYQCCVYAHHLEVSTAYIL